MKTNLPHRQRNRLLGIVAAAAAVAALSLSPAAQANTAQITTTSHTAVAVRQAGTAAGQPISAGKGLQPVQLPGMTAARVTVTLPTGQGVLLTRAGAGRYTVTSDPGDPSAGPVITAARGGPHGTDSLLAIPAAADALVVSGALDRSLFDLRWLTSHGDSGNAPRLDITIQYAGTRSAASLADQGRALPGAAVAAVHPAAQTVDLTVAASQAAAFWTALTGQKTAAASVFVPGQRPATLAGEAIHAWATGHHIAAATPTPADEPTYQVTEVIKRSAGGEGCGDQGGEQVSLCVNPLTLYLTAVTGSGEGNTYAASGLTCVDTNPCTTLEAFYSVPAGVYSADGFGFFYIDQQEQDVDLLSPQITVADNTSFTIDVDTAQPITVSTPRPSQTFEGGVLADFRGTSDNGDWWTQAFILDTNAYLPHFWATPTEPVTTGTFHLYSELLLGKPLLSMTVAGPRPLALDAMYSTQFEYPTANSYGVVRFPRQESLQLVDAGYGTTQDFADINARGKLALIRMGEGNGNGYTCLPGGSGTVLDDQLDNAISAGAAGVLVDSQDPAAEPDGWCSLPVHALLEGEPGTTPPDIPFVSLPVSQADTLIKLLANQAVKINVASYDGNSPYVYEVSLYREGFVPDSPLHTTLTDSQLSEVTDRYQTIQPGSSDQCWSPWRPSDFSVGGMCYQYAATPAEFQLYRGPLSPDTVQLLENQGSALDGTGLPYQQQQVYDVANQATGSDDWFAVPVAPGTVPVSADVLQAQPGKWSNLADCLFCRQGDTFYPFMSLISGADPRLSDANTYFFAPGSIHLYSGGQEIPPNNLGGLGIAVYQLPPGAAHYHMDTAYSNVNGTGTTTTSWDFTSSHPSTDQTPPGHICFGVFAGSTDPCAQVAMLFLRYNAHTNPDNTLTAPGAHSLDVTAYDPAPDAPRVSSLKLWISTDSGATWQPLHVTDLGNGNYTAGYSLPALGKAGGSLSIKAAATDTAGDDVSQTLLDSVKLTATSTGS
jgi:hypothetical protein